MPAKAARPAAKNAAQPPAADGHDRPAAPSSAAAESGAGSGAGPGAAVSGDSAVPEAPGRIPVRVGVGGPVGAGKTALIAALCLSLSRELSMAVVTNDAFTADDAETLRRGAVLEPERIAAVRTGCAPQAAIRDDIAGNLDAVEALENFFHPLDLVLVESGGDDLSSSFSKGLIDRQIFVIDVAAGPQVPRKGGPGITASDLLVVNKTDLAPHVDADLDELRRDAVARRQDGPVLFTSLREHPDAPAVADWVRGLITERRATMRG